MSNSYFRTLSLEEKAKLFVGKNNWELEPINRKSLFLSDGPHGIRKEYIDFDKKKKTVKAICYPAACLSACSFDPNLIEEMGKMLGAEAIKNKVDVLLGPGTNIKRNPLCGRNFEYFSEDPLLSGKLSAAYIRGVQSKNVGVSLKHFCCNSQEKARFINDSIVDERALREIYLKPFEIAIKEADPWTIMASYNKINGVRACENEYLLTDIARKEFGFKGAFISDWGAIDNPVNSIKAGLDLEMPGNSKGSSEKIIEAIHKGELNEDILNNSTRRLLDLYDKTENKAPDSFDIIEGMNLSERINDESIVLLKNENHTLPLKKNDTLLVVGDFADNPRYQGGGSSAINPAFVSSLNQELRANNICFSHSRGYNLEELEPNKALIDEATEKASKYSHVVIMCGLPRSIESEGYDRENLRLPKSHLALIYELAQVNKNIIIVLQNGSPVEMPFVNSVGAIIEAYLGGSMNARSLYKILYGEVNPSGRLAESFPIEYGDVPSHKFYLENPYFSLYKESIFVGYRYYDTFKLPVLFPFGYGLSYSETEFSDPRASVDGDNIICKIRVKNLSNIPCKEVIEIYAHKLGSMVLRANKELVAFKKISLSEHEEKDVEITFPIKYLKHFDLNTKSYKLEGGLYKIFIAKNLDDTKNSAEINLISNDKVTMFYPKLYYKDPAMVSDEEFLKLLKNKPDLQHRVIPYTKDTPIIDLYSTALGRMVFKPITSLIIHSAKNKYDKKMYREALPYQPIRSLQVLTSLSKNQIEGIVNLCNGHIKVGLKKIFKK